MPTFESTWLPTPTSFRSIKVVGRFFRVLFCETSYTTETIFFVPDRTGKAFTVRSFAALCGSIGYCVLNGDIEFFTIVP
jgi:hypothetical protein